MMEYQLDIFHTFGKNDGVAGQLEPKMNLLKNQQHEANFGIPIDYKKTMTQEEEELYSNFKSIHGFLFLLACDKNKHTKRGRWKFSFGYTVQTRGNQRNCKPQACTFSSRFPLFNGINKTIDTH